MTKSAYMKWRHIIISSRQFTLLLVNQNLRTETNAYLFIFIIHIYTNASRIHYEFDMYSYVKLVMDVIHKIDYPSELIGV